MINICAKNTNIDIEFIIIKKKRWLDLCPLHTRLSGCSIAGKYDNYSKWNMKIKN